MALLTREAFFATPPTLPREKVTLPDGSGEVYVRMLTATERDALEVKWEETKRKHFRARVVVATACDESGKNLFAEADIPAIGARSTAVIGVIYDAAMKLNKFTKEDVEELEKNSESGPSDAS